MKSKKKLYLFLLFGFSAIALAVNISPRWVSDSVQLNSLDQIALARFHRCNQIQMQMAKMAYEKAKETEIKNLAQNVYKDHRAFNNALEEIAAAEGIDIIEFIEERREAIETAKVKELIESAQLLYLAESQAESQKVKELYPQIIVDSSSKIHQMLKRDLPKIENPNLSELVSKSLPVIRYHASLGESLDESALAE